MPSKSWEEKWEKEREWVIDNLQSHSDSARIEAVDWLGGELPVVARAIDPLIQALEMDRCSYVRGRAAWALGKMETVRAITPLIRALQDVSEYVQNRAAEALDRITNNDKALADLVQSLRGEDLSAQKEARTVLEQMAQAESIRFAVHDLRNDYNHTRRSAAQTLRKLGKEAKAALPSLLKALDDEDFFVRITVIETLGAIGDNQAIPHLARYLNDENRRIRETAAKALSEIETGDNPSPI